MAAAAGAGAKPLPLFRAEAVAAHHDLRWGKPIGLMPLSWRAVSLFLLLLVAAAVVFLVTASYARKETARGILKPVGGEVRVVATQGGTLRDLPVHEGDVVVQGAPLARISRETQLVEGSSADEQVLASVPNDNRGRLGKEGQVLAPVYGISIDARILRDPSAPRLLHSEALNEY